MVSKDSWKTTNILLEGGKIINEDMIEQGIKRPGSLIATVNFEAALKGGYRRVSGNQRFINVAVPNSGQVLGTFAWNTGVVAMRKDQVYYAATGATSWTNISSAGVARTSAGKYRSTRYNWGKDTITFSDGVNKPAKIDVSTSGALTYTDLSNAPIASYVQEFRRYLFLALEQNEVLTFSSPGLDNDYNASGGAGTITVGFGIHGLGVWRDELFVFGRHNISRITGSSATSWVLSPVTKNIGCVAPDSIQEIGGDLVFLSSDGVRTIAGTMRIGDVDVSNLSRTVQTDLTALIPIENFSDGSTSSCIIRSKSQYRLMASRASAPISTQGGILGCLRQNSQGSVGWEWFPFQGQAYFCCDSRYLNNESELTVHANNDSTDGFVYQDEQPGNFTDKNGNLLSVQWSMQIPHLSLDDPQQRKTLFRIVAYILNEGAATINVQPIYDLGDSTIAQPSLFVLGNLATSAFFDDFSTPVTFDTTFTFSAGSDPNTKLQAFLTGSGRTCSLVISGSGGQAFTIRSLVFEYALNGRK